MLLQPSGVGLFHRRLWRDGLSLLVRECCDIGPDFRIVWICDGNVSVIAGLLHSCHREMEPSNPTKHVTMSAMQIHELLRAVQEDIGRTFDEKRFQETLEILDSVVEDLSGDLDQEVFCESHACRHLAQ